MVTYPPRGLCDPAVRVKKEDTMKIDLGTRIKWQRKKEAEFIRGLRRQLDANSILEKEEKFKFPAYTLLICLTLGALILLIVSCDLAHADSIPESRAVNAIIGEAENQGTQGMLAVACGIYNRGTLRGVYGEKAPRVVGKKYSKETYTAAARAWDIASNPQEYMSLNEYGAPITACEFLGGADHWENINAFGKPAWANKMIETYRYKDHVFYRNK